MQRQVLLANNSGIARAPQSLPSIHVHVCYSPTCTGITLKGDTQTPFPPDKPNKDRAIVKDISFEKVLLHLQANRQQLGEFAVMGFYRFNARFAKRLETAYLRQNVYSAVVLNWKLLKGAKVYCDPKICVMEDIEFNERVNDAGLLVCKCYRYAQQKKNYSAGGCCDMQPKIQLPPPPQKPRPPTTRRPESVAKWTPQHVAEWVKENKDVVQHAMMTCGFPNEGGFVDQVAAIATSLKARCSTTSVGGSGPAYKTSKSAPAPSAKTKNTSGKSPANVVAVDGDSKQANPSSSTASIINVRMVLEFPHHAAPHHVPPASSPGRGDTDDNEMWPLYDPDAFAIAGHTNEADGRQKVVADGPEDLDEDIDPNGFYRGTTNACYAISVFQCMKHIPEVYNAIINVCDRNSLADVGRTPSACLHDSLRRLLTSDCSKEHSVLDEFFRQLGQLHKSEFGETAANHNPPSVHTQQDVGEFFANIILHLVLQTDPPALVQQGHGGNQDLKGARAWYLKAAEMGDIYAMNSYETGFMLHSSIPGMFRHQEVITRTCSSATCNRVQRTATIYYVLRVPCKATLQDSIDAALQPETVPAGEQQHPCEKCGESLPLCSVTCIAKPPALLAVYVKRFERKGDGTFTKIRGSATVSDWNGNLTLPSHTAGEQPIAKYRIMASCNHIGNGQLSGHYTQTCREQGQIGPIYTWTYYNDNHSKQNVADINALHQRQNCDPTLFFLQLVGE